MINLDDELNELMQTRIEPDAGSDGEGKERLLDFMTQRIEALLASQFEALMSMMYRLDVNEGKLRKALSPTNPENPARSLARLIIERQEQRMATRTKYKKGSPDDWIDFD